MNFFKSKAFKVLELFMAALTPIVPGLIFVGFFVFCDLITGIWKAKKNGESIQSKKLGNTITKVVMYFMVIICARILDVEFNLKFLPFTIAQLAVGFATVTEFKSITENAGAILGVDLWKYLQSRINALRDAK